MLLRIKDARKAIGKRQKDLASELSVVQGAVSNWERGVSLPRIQQLPSLAKALNCSIDDLFEQPNCTDTTTEKDHLHMNNYIKETGD